jgi:hypothetical protein
MFLREQMLPMTHVLGSLPYSIYLNDPDTI